MQLLPLERTFSEEEFENLSMGFIPEQMEDKWFIYMEANCLYFLRSWSGACVYMVRLDSGPGHRVLEASFAPKTSPSLFTEEYPLQLLSFLIDRLLLGKDVPFPLPETIDGDWASPFRHSIVGYARSRQEKP